MRYTLEQITEEQAEALLPLDDVKVWAKVQYNLEDNLLKRVRKAVILKAEKFTGKLFVRRGVTAWPTSRDYSECNDYPYRNTVLLPYATNTSVTEVLQTDRDGTETPLVSGEGYHVFGLADGRVGFSYSYPHYQNTITYTAGYDVTSDDLDDLIVACEQMITGFFQHRKEFETGTIVITIPSQAQSILRSYISNPLFV